jgi:hypothetical protein
LAADDPTVISKTLDPISTIPESAIGYEVRTWLGTLVNPHELRLSRRPSNFFTPQTNTASVASFHTTSPRKYPMDGNVWPK